MGATPTFEGFGRWPVAGQRMEPKDFQISVFQSRIFQNLARAQCSWSEWFIQTSDICLFLRYMNYAPIYSLGRGELPHFHTSELIPAILQGHLLGRICAWVWRGHRAIGPSGKCVHVRRVLSALSFHIKHPWSLQGHKNNNSIPRSKWPIYHDAILPREQSNWNGCRSGLLVWRHGRFTNLYPFYAQSSLCSVTCLARIKTGRGSNQRVWLEELRSRGLPSACLQLIESGEVGEFPNRDGVLLVIWVDWWIFCGVLVFKVLKTLHLRLHCENCVE